MKMIQTNNNDCMYTAVDKLHPFLSAKEMKRCDIFGIPLSEIYGDAQIGPDALDVYLKNYCLRVNLITLTYGRYDNMLKSPTISYKRTVYGDEDGSLIHNFIVLVNGIDSKGLEGADHYYCIDGDKLSLFVNVDEIIRLVKNDCNYVMNVSIV